MAAKGTDSTLSFVVEQQDYNVWMPTGRVLDPDSRSFAPLQAWRAKTRYTDDGHWLGYDIWMLYGEREYGGPGEAPELDQDQESEA